jgi:3-oxoacyl-[acyl-carrier protein] reductase
VRLPRGGSLLLMSTSLEGRVALVTGAASGIGRAVVQVLTAQGATVAATDRSAPPLDAAGVWAMDVRDAEAVERTVAAAVESLGPIDVLVNCAGVSIPAAIEDDQYFDAWDATMAVNLAGQVRLVRACLPYLMREETGRVINIASTEGLGATPYLGAYTASKHGVVGITRSLACEIGPRGVTVNCVCPGPIHTGMTAMIPDAAKEIFARRRVPLRRYGEPEEVGAVVAFLASRGSSYVNGAVIPVDGGMSCKFG